MTCRTYTPRVKAAAPFDAVRGIGLTLPDVQAVTRYDGAPVLKLRGCFLAGLATHPSAEPDTLVVRVASEDRDLMLADAPETYYVTDYYRRHPVVLARLRQLSADALRELLLMSWRLTDAKAGRATRRQPNDRRATPARPPRAASGSSGMAFTPRRVRGDR